jgi:Fasciclin domain
MRIRSIAATLATTALLGGAAVVPASAALAEGSPSHDALGHKSLATVLTSDGNRFDRNWKDYDIVTEAALAVIKAKPDSPVSVLTKGWVPVTAFIPNDWSFRRLAQDLTGTRFTTEKQVFNALAGLGIDTIETVLLYHVVPGATIDSKAALGADGVALTTAQGGTVTVDVIYPKLPIVQLKDQDPDATDPFLDPTALDINKGNRQIAHGIVLVLRPADL